MFKQNKRGLSAVITTLLIILLTIVAIGIVWVVIKNLTTQGSEQIALSQKCTSVELKAVKVNETSAGILPFAGTYEITLSRTGTGGELGGIKVSVFNDTLNSQVIDFGLSVGALETKTSSLNATTGVGTMNITNGNKIEFTAYFKDASGNEQLCSQTNSFEF